jgi:hypothetical protein
VTLAISLGPDGALGVTGATDPVELWGATRRFFIERRPQRRDGAWTYPETTNLDVYHLVRLWRAQLRAHWRSDIASRRGQRSREDWTTALYAVDLALLGAAPAAAYRDNRGFWLKLTKPLSTELSIMRDQPSQREVVIGAIKHTVATLPGKLLEGAGDLAGGAADALETAGGVVAAPVRGLFRGLFGDLGRPLLIGAAVVGAVIVVPRLARTQPEPKERAS